MQEDYIARLERLGNLRLRLVLTINAALFAIMFIIRMVSGNGWQVLGMIVMIVLCVLIYYGSQAARWSYVAITAAVLSARLIPILNSRDTYMHPAPPNAVTIALYIVLVATSYALNFSASMHDAMRKHRDEKWLSSVDRLLMTPTGRIVKRAGVYAAVVIGITCLVGAVYYYYPKEVSLAAEGVKYRLGTSAIHEVELRRIRIEGKIHRSLRGERTYKGIVELEGMDIPVPKAYRMIDMPLGTDNSLWLLYHYAMGAKSITYGVGHLYFSEDYRKVTLIM